MSNTISVRIFDFLKHYPPFSMLNPDALHTIAQSVNVLYFEEDDRIFRKGEQVANNFYIVKDGAVGIYAQSQEQLVDKCDEGDIFGLRALIRKDFYTLCAVALEESIVYSISSDILNNIIITNPEARHFVQIGFTTNTGIKQAPQDVSDTDMLVMEQNLFDAQTADFTPNPITCCIDTTIKQAATLMTEHNVGSIIITHENKPLGIITNKDLRGKIATGKHTINEKVSAIMSAPVITRPPDITISEAQITMIKNNITHLCITQDGSNQTVLLGILSEHDIVVSRGNNPSALIKQIKRAEKTSMIYVALQKAQKLLAAYLHQNIPIAFVTRIITEINNTIQIRAIELSLHEMAEKPPVGFAWLALGSMGRREQLLLTDQDNALVFENVPADDYQRVKKYFLKLAENVNKKLNTAGYEYCPANMMAKNPKWCLSVQEWKKQFDNWITTPSHDKIMLSTIFFDYSFVYGKKELTDQMTASIYQSINKYEIFLNYLGVNALKNPPPLSFFRNFLVEDSGEHKNQFDVKARALMPLTDAARLLALSHNLQEANNTVERFEKIAELEPHNSDLYQACIESFNLLLKFRTQQGLQHEDSGRYIDLNLLSKTDKLHLRSAFKPIKAVQELIQVRFNLSAML